MQGEEDCGRAGALSTAILATGDQSTGSDWMRKATCDERLAIGDWRLAVRDLQGLLARTREPAHRLRPIASR